MSCTLLLTGGINTINIFLVQNDDKGKRPSLEMWFTETELVQKVVFQQDGETVVQTGARSDQFTGKKLRKICSNVISA